MANFVVLSVVAMISLGTAAPEARITARAELHPRADPSVLGYVSTSGASLLTDLRSCDYPATLTQSGSYAQCCEPKKPCAFFTSCSAGNVIGDSTSIFCDNGYCNTAVIVPSTGAKDGKSYLGCWATDLGKDAFALVQSTVAPTSTKQSSDTKSSSTADPTGTATDSSDSESETGSSSQRSESAASPSSSGAAAGFAQPLTGFVGFVAGLVAML